MANFDDEILTNQDVQSLSDEADLDTSESMLLPITGTQALSINEQSIVDKIIEAPNSDELQKQLNLFNMNLGKKNALRIVKLNNLLDKVEDQAIERFEKRPDQVSNKELLDYMEVISGQIDRAQRQIDTVSNAPAVTVTAQKTDVTINVGSDLDRDGKERVMDAISALLKQVKAATAESANVNTFGSSLIEADFEDKTEESDNSKIVVDVNFTDSDTSEDKE